MKIYFNKKFKEKKKEWEAQIERAKWKSPVQAYGELKCENGHEFKDDLIYCGKCGGALYWVDSDERYVICKGCNEVTKMPEKLFCSRCGAPFLFEVKWIRGYKP